MLKHMDEVAHESHLGTGAGERAANALTVFRRISRE